MYDPPNHTLIEGHIWEDSGELPGWEKGWRASVPLLGYRAFGRNRRETLHRIEEQIWEDTMKLGVNVWVDEIRGDDVFGLGADDADALVAFMLRRLRDLNNMSIRRVAARMGASPNSYAQYEQGKRKPSLAQLGKLLGAISPKLALVIRAR